MNWLIPFFILTCYLFDIDQTFKKQQGFLVLLLSIELDFFLNCLLSYLHDYHCMEVRICPYGTTWTIYILASEFGDIICFMMNLILSIDYTRGVKKSKYTTLKKYRNNWEENPENMYIVY